MVRTALSPTPIPSTARPPESSFSVAIALATTARWRVTGFVTPVASCSRLVRVAQTASVWKASRKIDCESATQMPPKPRRSASAATSAISATGRFGRIPTWNAAVSMARLGAEDRYAANRYPMLPGEYARLPRGVKGLPEHVRSERDGRGGTGDARARDEVADPGRGQRAVPRARGGHAAAARALPPRRAAADRHPHRLRHRQLRRLHRSLQRTGDQVVHAPRRAGRRRLRAHGRGPRGRRRRAVAAATGVQPPPRPAVRLLHPGNA